MDRHLKLLGLRVRDMVTGFEGVVSSISFDLYGCVQAVVTPEFQKKTANVPDAHWFDTKRLKVLAHNPVMPVPTFETIPGGQAKPGYPANPIPR